MRTYTLTATWGGKTSMRRIEAGPSYEGVRLAEAMGESDPEQAATEFDAVAEAIMLVMNLAREYPRWAKGRIELRDDRGALLHEMSEKS